MKYIATFTYEVKYDMEIEAENESDAWEIAEDHFADDDIAFAIADIVVGEGVYFDGEYTLQEIKEKML